MRRKAKKLLLLLAFTAFFLNSSPLRSAMALEPTDNSWSNSYMAATEEISTVSIPKPHDSLQLGIYLFSMSASFVAILALRKKI